MTTRVDLYYTMRSPYCYIATPLVSDLVARYNLTVDLKPVYPLAVSDPSFFDQVNPMWPPYLAKDTRRIAARLNIPFHWPRPDPIVQDADTRKIADEQPYIGRLTHFAQIAAERNRGFEYVCAVSALLYNPEIDGWDQGDHLARAMADVGLDIDEFTELAHAESERLEAAVLANRQAQLATGHWGAPLFVHQGEIFFGQDRIEDLVWYLKQQGLEER